MKIYLILDDESQDNNDSIKKLAVLDVQSNESLLIFRSILEILERSGLTLVLDGD